MDDLSTLSRFAILMGLAVLLPRLMERFRLPGVLGFLIIGFLAGPEVLAIVNPHNPAVHLFADLGKLLFMFFVGFEVDLEEFKKSRRDSMVFGTLTFLLPFGLGLALARVMGYSWNAAALIGSLLASHTLLGFPILKKLGLIQRPSVLAVIGGTIITDIAAMLVLALCVSIHVTGFSWSFLGIELLELAIYVPVIILGLGWLARKALVRFGDSAEMRMLILLVAIVIASESAEVIHLEGIVGAFLAGIAIRRSCRGKFAVEPLEVTAQALFIPAFFISTGFLINLMAMRGTLLEQPGLVLGLVGALVVGKWLAASLSGRVLGYASTERGLVWSLSLPQMAATLASAVVAYQTTNAQGEPLIDASVVNAVLLLVALTCVVGPTLTQRMARGLRD